MKPFNVKLTDAERERLEAHRGALGLRSQADVIRHWIGTPIVKAQAEYVEVGGSPAVVLVPQSALARTGKKPVGFTPAGEPIYR